MAKYSGYLLYSANSAPADFFSVPLRIQAGAAFSYPQEADGDILLAGGFPAIHPDASFPLSPTLQLNGDLTDMDDTGLAALARAEFIRESSQSYRSYTLDSDPRVAVLGGDADSLHTFIDTYGGVLQIAPILLQGYDPQLTTAGELEIEKIRNSFQLHFTVKKPIDLSRCTYCGACGPACPEHCLSEQLFLDFSRCSFCNECLAACPHGAIDLYGVERRKLMTPAILLLDGAEIDLPEQHENIYAEDTLPALFASLYSTEIEEIIGWDSTVCQYSAKLGTGCSACVSSCHHNAIQQGREGVAIDHLACVECGSCLSSCPTGALHYKRFDDLRFVEYFSTMPLAPGTRVVIGDETSLHTYWWHNSGRKFENVFFLEFPSPASLHSMHLLLLYGMGAKEIFVLDQENRSLALQLQFSNDLLRQLLQLENPVRLIQWPELTAVLEENQNRDIATTACYQNFSYSNRREKLIDLIQFFRLQGDGEPALLKGAATADFGAITCDEEKCTHCTACVNECRVGALLADSENYSLNHTPAQCVQCGVCVAVCPENALAMQPGLLLADSFFTEGVIAQAEPARCKGCGKIFGTRKSLEKVVAILSARNMWDSEDDLLSYCEDCRVINLYESAGK
ncbi:MAG: 4Fe-4S binding protein [Thermodesulfobacteriota bacterium]